MCLDDREPITGAAQSAQVGGATVRVDPRVEDNRRMGIISARFYCEAGWRTGASLWLPRGTRHVM